MLCSRHKYAFVRYGFDPPIGMIVSIAEKNKIIIIISMFFYILDKSRGKRAFLL